MFSIIKPKSHLCFVLIGDFNVDYFCTNSFLYKRLNDLLSLHQFVQSATHVDPSSTSSFIDLVFMSNYKLTFSCSPIGDF